jgi:hypothetical protein
MIVWNKKKFKDNLTDYLNSIFDEVFMLTPEQVIEEVKQKTKIFDTVSDTVDSLDQRVLVETVIRPWLLKHEVSSFIKVI